MSIPNVQAEQVRGVIERARGTALTIGIVGLILWGIGLFTQRELAFQGYHFAYIFWAGLSIGCLGMTLLVHVVRGKWGQPLVRIFEAGAQTIVPMMVILFIPILLGMHAIFEWSHAEAIQKDPIIAFKAKYYLNLPFFVIRFVIYFALWGYMTYLMVRSSTQQDTAKESVEAELISRQRMTPAALSIPVYVLAVTFFTVDMAMSLQPHWFSTMYGVIFLVGFGLTAMALATLLILLWRDIPPYKGLIHFEFRRDWGNLLFTMTVFWSYVSFSQLLIIYSGNLPEETSFYLRRNSGGWHPVSWLIVIFHFFVPFFLLLAPRTKRIPQQLILGVVILLAIRVVEIFWEIKPAFSATFSVSAWDVAAFVGLGGLWFWATFGYLLKRPLLPQNEPRLLEVAHEH
jgi:hypothetical protein